MKIRSHFIILIAVLTAVPILYLTGFAVYLYIMSPERTLIKGFEASARTNKSVLTKKDKETIARFLRERPPELEEAFLFADGSVVVSSIPEIPDKGKINLLDFSERFLGNMDPQYFQISSLPLENFDERLIHIVLFPKKIAKTGLYKNAILPRPRDFVLFFAVLFETAFIIFSLVISRRIEMSIKLVERKATGLANGDTESPITPVKNSFHSNEITELLKTLENFRLTFKKRRMQRDSFVMGLSHDLKTPLAVIKGYTEALQDGVIEEGPKKERALDLILQKCASLETMIDNLISFVMMNETDYGKNFQDLDLGAFLENYASYAKTNGELFSRFIKTSIEIPLGTITKMDGQLMERAFGNILSNAIRYSKARDTIFFEASVSNKGATIIFRDQGVGMSQEEQSRVFELFYRGSASRREQGQGIGLSVVKTVMDIHGWSIKVESEPGKGSAFEISVPAQKIFRRAANELN